MNFLPSAIPARATDNSVLISLKKQPTSIFIFSIFASVIERHHLQKPKLSRYEKPGNGNGLNKNKFELLNPFI